MKTPLITLLLLISLLTLFSLSSCSSCNPSCGPLPIHYPFGIGPGCGSPLFQPHVTCNPTMQTLTLTTPSGTYPIQSIDYINQILTISDQTMSSCSFLTSSPGFSLDPNSPFTFVYTDLFLLLGCSQTNSTLCDASSSNVCGLLYTCPAISALSQPVSTCCIYAPTSLGPAFEMDLKGLGCSSYTGVYGFGGSEANPNEWEYGVAVKYRFSVDQGYPSNCADCEKSYGVCGYNLEEYDEFTCNCANGMNSSSNCYWAGGSWSGAGRWPAAKFGSWLVFSFFVIWYGQFVVFNYIW